MAGFPQARLRRLRGTPSLRRMVQETRLSPNEFIYPLFVTHGHNVRQEIGPLPGCYQLSLDLLEREAVEVASLGIPAVLLFGIPEVKDAVGSGAYDDDGIIQQASSLIKKTVPELMVIGDVCLCEYTDHGHCGVVKHEAIDNDATLELLARTALSQVAAGADAVAPSAMMDGQVGAIRTALDGAGHTETPVIGYSAKYASALYGPFRVAAESTPRFGDRHTYQMDPANSRMAMREIETDIQEGADVIMVKPALAYLDVIARVREQYNHPIAAYSVSGEYAMVHAAAQNEWIDGRRVALELLTAIKRAGADMIITYFAKDAARWLAEDRV